MTGEQRGATLIPDPTNAVIVDILQDVPKDSKFKKKEARTHGLGFVKSIQLS